MRIEPITADMLEDWLALRLALWPDAGAGLRAQAKNLLVHPDALALIASEGDTRIGFVEAALRRDYVNGCETSPVAFVEGLYVHDDWRNRGVARALVVAVEDWAQRQGVTEIASDALLDNRDAHAMHKALGFAETERVIYFRKALS